MAAYCFQLVCLPSHCRFTELTWGIHFDILVRQEADERERTRKDLVSMYKRLRSSRICPCIGGVTWSGNILGDADEYMRRCLPPAEVAAAGAATSVRWRGPVS